MLSGFSFFLLGLRRRITHFDLFLLLSRCLLFGNLRLLSQLGLLFLPFGLQLRVLLTLDYERNGTVTLRLNLHILSKCAREHHIVLTVALGKLIEEEVVERQRLLAVHGIMKIWLVALQLMVQRKLRHKHDLILHVLDRLIPLASFTPETEVEQLGNEILYVDFVIAMCDSDECHDAWADL